MSNHFHLVVAPEQLERWRKGHRFKVRVALKLRAKTTVTVGPIGERLHMGTREHAAKLLARGNPAEANIEQPTLGM